MLAQYLDLTKKFNDQNGSVYVETSNYDYCVIQFIGSTNSIGLRSTIDSGTYPVSTNKNIFVPNPDNFMGISFINLADGSIITTISETDGLIKVGVVGRYLQIKNSSAVDKLLVMLAKIS